MATRSTPTSPHERRARRIRIAVWATFAAFILVSLFAIAAYGFMVTRRVPPMEAVPADPPIATLRFHLPGIISHFSADGLNEGPAGAEYLHRELRALQFLLADEALLFFWPHEEDGTTTRWALYFPLIRPQSLNIKRIRRALLDSNVLHEIDSPSRPAREVIGYFHIDARGVVITSTPLVPDFTYAPMEGTAMEAEARYVSPEGWLAPFLSPQFSRPAIFGDDCPRPLNLEILWAAREFPGEVRLQVACDEEILTRFYPYFFPFSGILEGTDTSP